MLFSRDPELKRRIATALANQRKPGFSLPLLRDPIEDEERVSMLLKEAQAKADAEIDSKVRMGRCHGIWSRTKKIMKEEHGIDWYSPREMNPGVRFD
jgi:hypothetical protein